MLAARTQAQVAQVLGRTVLLYRPRKDKRGSFFRASPGHRKVAQGLERSRGSPSPLAHEPQLALRLDVLLVQLEHAV